MHSMCGKNYFDQKKICHYAVNLMVEHLFFSRQIIIYQMWSLKQKYLQHMKRITREKEWPEDSLTEIEAEMNMVHEENTNIVDDCTKFTIIHFNKYYGNTKTKRDWNKVEKKWIES